MLFVKAKDYQPANGDTLKSIATSETQSGNAITWKDIAQFNWGVNESTKVYEMLRQYGGCTQDACAGEDLVFTGAGGEKKLQIPKKWAVDNLELLKTHTVKVKPVAPKPYLRIATIDDHFAPKHEKLDLKYNVCGLSGKKITLKITSAAYTDGVIYQRDLTNQEKQDGNGKTLATKVDGTTTCNAGPLAGNGKYMHPLYSPYTVTLEAENGPTCSATFKILYHKIELSRGSWKADGSTPNVNAGDDWYRYKLNELGYWGGPFTSDDGIKTATLRKAVKQYKSTNAAFLSRLYGDNTVVQNIEANPASVSVFDSINHQVGQFNNLLRTQLQANNNRRTGIERANNPITNANGTAKLFVPSLYYQKGDQFQAGNSSRTDEDVARLTSPIVPIKAKVHLKAKNDSAVFVPEATGPVSIGWRVLDPPEPGMDARYEINIRHDPNQASDDKWRKTYIEAVQSFLQTEALTYSDGTPFVKNCPTLAGGKANLRDLFIDWVPFTRAVRGGLACTPVVTDANSALRGYSGVNFMPSFIGGDSYRVIADLDFGGHGFSGQHVKALVKAHGGHPANHNPAYLRGRDSCKVQTGVFTIWRDAEISKVVKWPGDPSLNQNELAAIARDYEQAYVRMSVPNLNQANNPAVVGITSVMTNSEYQTLVKDHFAPQSMRQSFENQGLTTKQATDFAKHATPGRAYLFWQKFNLRDDAIYGRDLPKQGAIRGNRYQAAVQKLIYKDTRGFGDAFGEPMARFIARKVRKTTPSGHIVVAWRPHRPVNVIDDPSLPRNQRTITQNWVAKYCSAGLDDGVVSYDLGDPDRRSYVLAHEFGHHNFLYHHQVGGVSEEPTLHDKKDQNCIMSYADDNTAPRIEGKYNPLFCGKCNLRLRGWNVEDPDPSFPKESP